MNMSDSEYTIREAIKNAVDNGYDLEGYSDEEIALDMIKYNSECRYLSSDYIKRIISECRVEGLLVLR